MKTRVLSLLSVLGMFLFGALTAHAETVLARAKIPFDFAVGNKTLPAGEYRVVKLDMAQQEILVCSTDGAPAVVSPAIAAEPKNNTGTMFVFSRYGSSYFLENIWLGLHVPHKLLDSNKVDEFITEQYKSQCNVLESPEPT